MIEPSPCLCGHAWHNATCACGCPKASPDYVAAWAPELAAMPEAARETATADLRTSQEELARQLGYRGPPGKGKAAELVEVRCTYCTETFLAPRKDATTCSGACRQAVAVALAYESDADVPSPAFRRDHYSKPRAIATGYGTVTAQEAYAADLRVRGAARTREPHELGTTTSGSRPERAAPASD